MWFPYYTDINLSSVEILFTPSKIIRIRLLSTIRGEKLSAFRIVFNKTWSKCILIETENQILLDSIHFLKEYGNISVFLNGSLSLNTFSLNVRIPKKLSPLLIDAVQPSASMCWNASSHGRVQVSRGTLSGGTTPTGKEAGTLLHTAVPGGSPRQAPR